MSLTDSAPSRANPFAPAPDALNGTTAVCAKRADCVKPAGHRGRCSKEVRARDARRNGSGAGSGDNVRAAGAGSKSTRARAGSRTRRKGTGQLKPFVAMGWAGLGRLLEQYLPEPAATPVGRVVQFQAPYAAEQLHPFLSLLPAYSRLDNAAGGGALAALGPLFIAPIVVGVMATNERAAAALEPLLVSQLHVMAGAIVQQRKEQAAKMAAVGDIDEEVAQVTGEMLGWLFGSPDDESNDERGSDEHSPEAAAG